MWHRACWLTFGAIGASGFQFINLSSSTVAIPYEYTYLLPDGFTGNLSYTFANGTNVPGNASINNLFHSASQAPFIAYSQEFIDLLGPNAEPQLIEDRTAQEDYFAFEAGVWVPELDEVWFTSSVYKPPIVPYRFNLKNNSITTLNASGTPLHNLNGGYYYDGKVWFTSAPDNGTWRGGIISVDVRTLHAEMILNSYFGLPLNGPDDLVWVTRGNKSYMFFSDLPYGIESFYTRPQLPSGVYRWDPQEEVLLQVISRNEIDPNVRGTQPGRRRVCLALLPTFSSTQNTCLPSLGCPRESRHENPIRDRQQRYGVFWRSGGVLVRTLHLRISSRRGCDADVEKTVRSRPAGNSGWPAR